MGGGRGEHCGAIMARVWSRLLAGYLKMMGRPERDISRRDEYGSKTLMYGHTYSKSMDQPGKVANPARGQLNKENQYFPVRVRA